MTSYRLAPLVATAPVVALVTILVAALAAPPPASAQNARAKGARGSQAQVYASISPTELAEILGGEEGSVKLDEGEGDTTLAGEIDGKYYAVYFYECDGGAFADPAKPDSACLGFEYRAYFENYPVDAEMVNAFNASHHYGALWRDDDGDLGLQLNVIVEGGVTADNIKVTFAWWRAVLKSFDEFMGDN